MLAVLRTNAPYGQEQRIRIVIVYTSKTTYSVLVGHGVKRSGRRVWGLERVDDSMSADRIKRSHQLISLCTPCRMREHCLRSEG